MSHLAFAESCPSVDLAQNQLNIGNVVVEGSFTYKVVESIPSPQKPYKVSELAAVSLKNDGTAVTCTYSTAVGVWLSIRANSNILFKPKIKGNWFNEATFTNIFVIYLIIANLLKMKIGCTKYLINCHAGLCWHDISIAS